MPQEIADIYLAARGIELAKDIHEADSLRFHSRCPVRISGLLALRPALVAKLVDTRTNEFRGI